ERLVRIAEAVVEVEGGDVADLEVADLVGTGADGLEVRGAACHVGAETALVLISLEDGALHPAAPLEDDRMGRPVRDDDGVRVTGHDALNSVAAIECRRGRRRVALVLLGADDSGGPGRLVVR